MTAPVKETLLKIRIWLEIFILVFQFQVALLVYIPLVPNAEDDNKYSY